MQLPELRTERPEPEVRVGSVSKCDLLGGDTRRLVGAGAAPLQLRAVTVWFQQFPRRLDPGGPERPTQSPRKAGTTVIVRPFFV